MRKQSPNWTSALAPFCPATLDCLGRNEALDDSFVLGGISQDGNIGWLARGNALEVFSGTSGERLAAWCFGNILREPSTCITCVCTYDCDSGCKMIVATSSETSRAGMLCLFCIKTSKVIRAIEVPCKVTAMELICVTGQTRDMPTLGEQLKSFCGILAVGTDGGHTFLLDMCLDDESVDGGELQLNEMCFISPRTSDIASVRYVAQSRRQNLALELGEDTQTKGWYLYRRPDSSVVKKYNAGHVTISCLKYMPQTGMLAIGFNFGCFQLWRLNVPVLEYSSRFEDDLAPVSTFAYQEPENDPRYFCYLWVGRGPLPHHDTDEYASTVMLFQMEFDKKTWYDSLGHVFEELTSVGPRFQHELTGDVKSPVEGSSGQNFGSRIIACSNLIDPRSMTNKGSDDQSFDDGGPSSLRLCMFAWEVQTLAPQSQHSCVLGVFDMNRWYHAQMPVSISVGASHEECPFFAFCSLDDVLAASNSEAVVTAHIPHLSITKFSPVLSPPDQHSYPSALSFDVFGISESGIVRAKFLGIQRQILADMLHGGTAVLIDPTEMYNRCLSAALLPRHMERSSIAVSLIDKREAVLSVALHHNLFGFITGCITQSASSSDYVGTLRLVVEWAWRTVTKIKESLDTICEPLHDWSGLQLDLESVQKLHHHNVALVHLVTIFQMLATHSATTTEQGRQELETKLAVLILIQQHVSIVVWFLSAGLLPEYSEERESSTDQFVYAAMKLQETYKQRRKVILQLPSEVRSTDILLIDGLVAAVGSSLSDLWLKDGSSTPNYPPPSLHALLNMYLLEDVSLASKHHITFYLLCDVYSTLPDELQVDFGDRLQQFGQRFGLPLGISRLLQGFWLLDHGDFEDSLSYLLDPLVSTDQMLPWQHTRIIKSLLYQGESRLALRYVRVKSPPMLTRGDIKLQLTVLLANGLISEAFEFQRSCRDKASAEDLLSHLFRGAQQTKTVDKLLQLPFTEEEETDLVRYLQGSEDKQAQELLVLYYLQRARFVEAVRLNDVLRKSDSDSGEVAVSRASIRNAIVDGYMRVLPGVQRRMSASLKGFMSQPSLLTKYKFVRPAPLSTVVHRSMKVKAVTQATLINSVLNKVHEVRTAYGGDDDNEEEMPRLDPEELDVVPDPFVGTPVAPRATRRSHTVNEIMFGPSTEISVRLMSPSSVSKRRLTSHLDVGMATGSPRINRSYAADAISLLQTPPVRRHTGGLKGLSSAHRQPDFVPQSIIKTKSTEVKRVNMSVSVTDGGRAGVTWPAMPELPTPPRPGRHKTTKISEAVSAIQVTTDIECTPKQLRFAEPASEKQGNDSPEAEPSSTSATPRVSFQHAVEHTKSAMRSQQKDPSPPKTGSARRGSPKLRHKDKKRNSDDSEEEDTAATYVEVDSDITFNFTTNLTTPHADMDTTDGPWEDTVSSSSGSTSPRKQTRRNSKKSNQRNSRGRKGGSPGGNKDEDMDVEEEGSDVEEQDSDVGSDMTRQGNDLVSLLGRERSPKELSVEHEEQLSAGESSSERLVTTPSPRLPLHHDTPSIELNRQSLFVMEGGSVGVSGDIGVSASEASLHENKVTAQASLIELRRSGAMSLDAGDTVNPVTAMHDLSSGMQRFTRFKEVRETVSSVLSNRVVSASVLQNVSVDLQTPPRPTRVSNLPLTPPLSHSPLPLSRSPLSLSRSPLRSHSMQQGLPQPSSLALRSTRSTSTIVTSPSHSRPSTSPIMTRATSRCASPSVAVGRSDSPVQQASSSSLRYSPSPDRSLSHSPQVTRRSGIRSKSRSVTPTQDVSKGNVVDMDSAKETKSSVGKLNTAKGIGSSVSNTDIMQSNVKCDDANVQVSSSRRVTLTRSESSSLSRRAMSIESLEATLNIPKSATKAFRSSTRKTRPSVSKSASKSVVKSALKSMTKSKKQHQQEDVEQVEDTTSQDHGSRGPLSGESFMMRLRTRPNSESRNSPEQKTVTTKDTTVENFTFSAPSEVTRDQSNMNEEGTHAVSRTPIQPFIFSPPITRTRSRVHRKEVAPPISMVIPEISALSPARNTRLASKRSQKQKEEKKKLQHSVIDVSPSDSVINFVSPVTSAEETGPRRRGKLVHPAGYSMTLRQKKAGKSKRNTLKW